MNGLSSLAVSSSSQPTVLGRLTNSLVTWMLACCLRRAERLSVPKRTRFLRGTSRGAVIGMSSAVLCGGGSALMCLFCGYGYATYPASPPEYPASLWIFFGVVSGFLCLLHGFIGLVMMDFRRRLKPLLSELG